MQRRSARQVANGPIVFVVDVSDLSVGSPNQRMRQTVRAMGAVADSGQMGGGEQSQRVHDHDDAVQVCNGLFTCALARSHSPPLGCPFAKRTEVLGKWPFAMAEE